MNTIACSACLLLVAVLFPPARCTGTPCDGYTLTLNSLKTCDESSVIKFSKDFSASLVEGDGKCFVVPNGCVTVARALDKAYMHYKVKRGMLPLSGNMDCCKAMSDNQDNLKPILAIFNLKDSCPMPAGTICNKNGTGIDITKDKGMFGMANGKTTGTVNIDHGNGKSCLKFQVTFSKG